MARVCIYNQKPFDKIKILLAFLRVTPAYTLEIFINIQSKKYYKLQYQAYVNIPILLT